ncbi:hypothetical protein T265_06271 [Opisthorchis viverrini]|uniref:Uncharacterized protein n=1 Tax=Opisthorchis viverrini TaxID=6198 RepID=A0A074ZGZ7_OPIVI|nr:hypothetical protein T265_06271 [Opisthorchis viverrini]KER26478.1 hypothetical protein T265_06271 [Opisthorchis viverrini]
MPPLPRRVIRKACQRVLESDAVMSAYVIECIARNSSNPEDEVLYKKGQPIDQFRAAANVKIALIRIGDSAHAE